MWQAKRKSGPGMLTIPSYGSFINVFVVSFIINNLPFSINRKQNEIIVWQTFYWYKFIGPVFSDTKVW